MNAPKTLPTPTVIIVMGVSGAGKTTIGKLLAQKLGWQFKDADDYHSQDNREKMHAGVPLTDQDRRPWLGALAQNIQGWLEAGEYTVLACSALKQSYRATLTGDSKKVLVVYLRADFEAIAARLAHRENHFMNKDLLQSQFASLEEPVAAQAGMDDLQALVIDATRDPEDITEEVLQQSGLSARSKEQTK